MPKKRVDAEEEQEETGVELGDEQPAPNPEPEPEAEPKPQSESKPEPGPEPDVKKLETEGEEARVTESSAQEALASGRAELLQGHLGAARDHFEAALAAFRDLKDNAGVADSLLDLGILFAFQGAYDTSELQLEQAMGICKKLGDVQGQVDILEQMGLVQTLRGDSGQALAYYQQAREMRGE
jgi:tetratricopeptide (TPR) repeat protein